jgi:hypothetical protein
MSSFFDRLKESVEVVLTDAEEKLRVGVDQVTSGVGEAFSEAHLRAQLRQMERERVQKLADLGAKVYAMHDDGEIHVQDLHEELQALDDLEQRIAAKQRQLEEAAKAT